MLNRNDMFKKIVNICKRFAKYCQECYNEIVHKTTWPTRSELTHSAMVVLSASLIIALVVFAMDSVFRFIMSMVYPG